ncbi:MAG: hypothetical protein JSW71_10115 [Gemmatimonadota bacterium]|nr:MAG: hypothetical protein JSW71_10115 [Gemmatimonadota bacterium]
MKLAGLGILLTALVGLLLWVGWDGHVALAGGAFGLLATLIHVAAVAALKRVWDAPFRQLVRGWGIGMGLRLGGAAVWMVVVLLWGELFPPIPTAIGYLGVLIPLLFTEIRFLK